MHEYIRLIRHTGNRDLFRAVEMSVAALVNDRPFHIQAEGLRGTGKTTIMRMARALLPPITRIKNCLYNCDPAAPHCPFHRHLSRDEIAVLGTEEVPRPFLEISQAAKPGTVVGSIDLVKLTDPAKPLAALLPGTIPQAHRGIVFIDEINRLADTSPELADILLDVMGTRPGRVQIEEPGLPVVELPVTVSIWAASNPDEDPGPLNRIRKQLADRFDLAVTMGRPDNSQDVVRILAGEDNRQRVDLPVCQPLGSLQDVTPSQDLREVLGRIYLEFNLESLRSITAMETAACLTALLAGRPTAGVAELMQVAPLALMHRNNQETIAAIMEFLNRLLCGQEYAPINCVASATSPAKAVSPVAALLSSLKSQIVNLLRNRPWLPDTGTQGSGQPGGAHIIDPLATTIIAPPNPATPITHLPEDQFVTIEINQHGR
ncbi:magnesium chelatase [Sporomusa aerivorans]|uniref:magnesium chelatase n=1 Tax=Sporomusa aerivorans TaxID=204936 RepID=UPI00352A698C